MTELTMREKSDQMRMSWDFKNHYGIRSPYRGIYEIFGLQRISGKTTLMTGITVNRLMNLNLETLEPRNDQEGFYKPEDVIVNYPIFIPGIKALTNEEWFETVSKIKRDGIRHKLILGDELNSILLARNTRDISQAEFAVYVWQMPKMDNMLIWTNNQLTGVDVIIRDGTWNTIMPLYYGTYLRFTVIHNYGTQTKKGLIYTGVERTQALFDSYAPAK